MLKTLLIALLSAIASACVHPTSHVQPVNAPVAQPLGLKTPAPINAELRDLPEVSASWFKPVGSAARLYVLEVGPRSAKQAGLRGEIVARRQQSRA